MKERLLKGGLVVFGALLLSSVGLFAADSLQGIDRSLVGLAGVGAGNLCPSGTVLIKQINVCVDVYEASPGDDCTHQEPRNITETENNIRSACGSKSESGKMPWRYVSLTQAQTICAANGKRLPSSDEWYVASVGINPDSCVTKSNTGQSGLTGEADCVSPVGVHDTIGNVWEWVNETVTNGQFEERELPKEGYVASVDTAGVAITTSEAEQEMYRSDYFWSKSEGTFGMIRGGFYGGGSDSGLFSINATVDTSFASAGVGFRCVYDL
jgi:formylglycine-generating enzyme required for sulfatase activity